MKTSLVAAVVLAAYTAAAYCAITKSEGGATLTGESSSEATVVPDNGTSDAGNTSSEICNKFVLDVVITAILTPINGNYTFQVPCIFGISNIRIHIYNNVPAKDLRISVTVEDVTHELISKTDEASVQLSTKQNKGVSFKAIGAKDFCDSLKYVATRKFFHIILASLNFTAFDPVPEYSCR